MRTSAYTAGEIDIKTATLALKKTKNPQVKAFAEDMVRDHTAVNDKALALLKKLNVQPQDNDTSRALVKQSDAEMPKLESLSGAAFDKAYIDNEVTYHRTVNDTLRSTLIPSASNPELKDLLTSGLKIFEGHQQHAEQLAKALAISKRSGHGVPNAVASVAIAVAAALACAASTGGEARQSGVTRIEMKNVAFVPAQVRVHVGVTLEWDNDDIVADTATSKDAGFDVNVPPGGK